LTPSIALTVLSIAPVCLAGVINFDNLTGPVALTNQYGSQGVLFSQIELTGQFASSVVTVSPPNYATPFYSNANPGMLWFVDPADSSIEAFVNSVSITLNGYNNVGGWFDGAIIDAFDANNVLISSQTIAPTSGANYGPMTITFTGQVHELQFNNILNAGRLGILPFDDLTFGAATDVPEPASWLLSGSMLVALISCVETRRRENRMLKWVRQSGEVSSAR
jgi:hypothetical protein